MSLFKPKRSLQHWLDEYAQSHQNATNKRIHWICVPAIFISIMGMLYVLSPWVLYGISVLVVLFYARLSWVLSLCMGVFIAAVLVGLYMYPVGFLPWFGVFVVAWVGQFIGHRIEGKKPSFLDDLQFLLIGPAWVAHSLYHRF